MNQENLETGRPMTREDLMSALFANMVLQQTNLAMMFLGRAPNPQTGEHAQDLEAAKIFIDQLEMLEVKTKNNLSKQEEGLLRQSLTAVRLAYVESANEKPAPGSNSARPSPAGQTVSTPEPSGQAAEPGQEADDTRKKFTKKY